MKLLGKISSYNYDNNYGYIEGADNEKYLFFKDSFKDNIIIKDGMIVKFYPLIENNIAIDIELVSNI